MPISRELEIQARKNISLSINKLIDRYLREGVQLRDMKKFFMIDSNFKNFLKDIQYESRRLFNDDEDYPAFVRKLTKEIIMDKIAEIEYRKMNETTVIKYNEFINESVQFDNISIDYLFTDIGTSGEDINIIANELNTRANYITSKNPKYCTYTVVDYTLDVTRNNRVNFDVMILTDFQIDKMKTLLIKNVISGIYSQLPEEISYMGISLKPHSLLDKEKMIEYIASSISTNDIIELISKLSGYKFEKDGGDYYLWKKLK